MPAARRRNAKDAAARRAGARPQAGADPRPDGAARPFWEEKRLEEMTRAEWESLCDGCGKCCLILLEEPGLGRYHETDVHCRLFDPETRRCTDYENRSKRVPDCVRLSPDSLAALDWMPETCAYRRLAHGQGLPDWHPLLTGDPNSVEDAGVAVRDVVSELTIEPEDLMSRVVAARPKRRRRRAAARRG
jgi:uncharacterized cysteine cluster protein YcgN (CxxCxxCC family)